MDNRPNTTNVYFDGTRLVRFTNFQDVPRPSAFDSFRQYAEDILGFRIDWWPLHPVWYGCPPGSTKLSYKLGDTESHINLPFMDVVNW